MRRRDPRDVRGPPLPRGQTLTLLVDTHLLIWAGLSRSRVPEAARRRMADPAASLVFSVASVWEVAIKQALGRPDFEVDAALWRRGLMQAGYRELDVLGAHAAEVRLLSAVHGDPFDRLLIAQARVEGLPLLTADRALAAYGAPVELV